MPNPVDVEKRFARLNNQLEGVLSKRVQWFRIYAFFDQLSGDFSTYDTYCLQIAPRLPSFDHPLDMTGIDPKRLVKFHDTLNELTSAVPELADNEKFTRASESLICSIAFQYLCLHELDNVLHTILEGEEQLASPKPGYNEKTRENIREWLQQLRTLPEIKQRHKVDRHLQTLLDWWEMMACQEKLSVFIPVYEAGLPGHESPGQLRQLSARILGPSNELTDIFHNNYALVGALHGDQGIDRSVADLVRSLVNKTHPNLEDQFFEIQFSYHLQRGFHQGKSSELGIALLGYSAIMAKADVRERFTIQSNIAFTGTLASDGNIGEVNPGSITAKLQAAFFSWMDYLVVPESQVKDFEHARDALLELYPNRELDIIGLSKFEETLYDRRITGHEQQSRTRYYLEKAWAHKFNFTSILLILALLSIIAALWYGPIDRNPVIGRFEGASLKLINADGQMVKSFHVDSEQKFYLANNASDGRTPQVQLFDINGDGLNEAFWFQRSSREQVPFNKITAWSVSGDSLLWELPLRFDVNFPKKYSIVDNEFYVAELQFVEDQKGVPLLIVNAYLRSFFPNLLLSVDVDSGEVIQKYVHAGRLYDIDVIDLDDDGIREVIATGVNNAYWKACLVALNPFDMEGHGPLKDDYVVDGFRPARELNYVMIPKTIVGQYYDPVQKMPYGFTLRKHDGGELIYVRVRDAGIVDIAEGHPVYVIYYFNKDFTVEGMGTDDKYDITARRLYQEGKIPFEPDYEYFEAFKDSLVYWEENR